MASPLSSRPEPANLGLHYTAIKGRTENPKKNPPGDPLAPITVGERDAVAQKSFGDKAAKSILGSDRFKPAKENN